MAAFWAQHSESWQSCRRFGVSAFLLALVEVKLWAKVRRSWLWLQSRDVCLQSRPKGFCILCEIPVVCNGRPLLWEQERWCQRRSKRKRTSWRATMTRLEDSERCIDRWRTCFGRRVRGGAACCMDLPFAVPSRSGADDHSRSFSLPQTVASSMTCIGRKLLPQLRMELGPGEENAMKKSVKLTRN